MYSEEQKLRFEHIVRNIDRLEGHIIGLSFDAFEVTPVLVDAVKR
jgi:hypothetical protein